MSAGGRSVSFLMKGKAAVSYTHLDVYKRQIEEIAGDYEPWFTPVFETALNGEIPGEIESLLFCVQTAIGVGIIAFLMGRMVERKKWSREEETEQKAGQSA